MRPLPLIVVLLAAMLALFFLHRLRAWTGPGPRPPRAVHVLDDFEAYEDTAALRRAWSGGELQAGGAAAGRGALRFRLPAGDRERRPPLRFPVVGDTPGNWSNYETFACMTRSLAAGKEGLPLEKPGEILDMGDYLYLEVEAPDVRTGLWRRARLNLERNRRHLSWSAWTRWQVDLRGDPASRDLDWERVRALRVAAAGEAPAPLFVYLDDCRLEPAWRPVQSPTYFFLGVNMWDIWGRGDAPFSGTALRRPFDEALRRDIREKLAYLAERDVPILRIFLDYHLEIDPGRGLFEDEILRRIDFIINTVRRNRWPLRLLISHSTGYDLQTGISWYARQTEGDAYEKVRAFYVNPALRAVYKRQLRHVIDHVNRETGVAWKNEPVIWGWDVSNEPRILYGTPGTTYASRTREMVSWYTEMSRHIRSLDSDHRIVSGTFYSGDGVEPHDEDYDDWNIWELFGVEAIDALSVQSYVGPHLLKTGPKPVLLEEFGYGGAYFEEPTDEKRADNYRWMLLDGRKAYLSGVGALVWQVNWNHGYPDGKEIHSSPPAMRFEFSPGIRNRSLDVFQFYLGKYNRLEVEPEIEEGWGYLGDWRWQWRSIYPPLVAVRGERFGEGYVTLPEKARVTGLRERFRTLLGRLGLRAGAGGRVENRLFIPKTGPYRLDLWARGPAGRAGRLEVSVDGGRGQRIGIARAVPAREGSPWHRVSLPAPLDLRYGEHEFRIRLLDPGTALHRYRLVPFSRPAP